MKKLLCIILCLLTALCFVGCKNRGGNLSDEPPLVELMARTLSDEYEFALVDDEGTVWLESDDVSTVLVMYKKGQNRYLEIRFTKEGAKQFKKAVKSTKNSNLSITLDGEVLVSPVLANEETPEYAKINAPYEELMNWFNKLT